MMLEQRLLEGLESGLKGGDTAERRQYHVTRSSVWELLPKEWKGLLLVALRKEEPPDEEENASPSPMRRQKSGGGRRMKRGRLGRSANQDLLPEKVAVLEDSTNPASFRMAVLLIHKSRDRDSWSESDESILVGLRSECSKGVHPAWGKMAAETPLLAEFAAHPVVEKTTEVESLSLTKWAQKARLDPIHNHALADWLALETPFILPPAAEVDLRRALIQLRKEKGRIGKVLTKELRTLEAPGTLIAAMLALTLNDDSAVELLESSCLEQENPALKEVVKDQILLHQLREGDSEGWKTALQRKGRNDGLSIALQIAGWQAAPAGDIDLELVEMQSGLDLLMQYETDKKASDKLRWHILSVLVEKQDWEEAENLLLQLNLSNGADIDAALTILNHSSSPQIQEWFENHVELLSSDALLKILSNDGFPSSLKLKAAALIENDDSNKNIQNNLLQLMIDTGDIIGLAEILKDIENSPEAYPLETLLVAHLHPAMADEDLNQWILSSAIEAYSSLSNTLSAPGLSPLSISLLHMLDGARCELEPLADRLDMTGFQAFRECRRAMSDVGDGLVSESNLGKLEKSIEEAELKVVERKLLETVVESLRLNRAATQIQNSNDEGLETANLDGIISGTDPRLRVVMAARDMVLEHNIALPSLVEWYQKTAPTSVWSTISKAAMQAAEGERLASARSWRLAADRSQFPYEQRVMLYRKALIHFAHSESWTEAIQLLDREQALQSALAKRFQLYLRVSDDAHRGQQETATLQLLDFVRSEKVVQVENRDGEIVDEMKVEYAEEELDHLFNYHRSHPIPLPREPFQGRVRAALNSVKKDRRRNRIDDEMRYQRLMHESSQDRDLDPLTHDIYNLASDAAEENAIRGLTIFERAMNSGRFKPRQIKRLMHAQQGVFQNHHREISIRQRKHLRHLPLIPLVIVDTNILIDSLKDMIAKKLDLSSDVQLDLVGHRNFHRSLLQYRKENKIRVFMPAIVQSEIRNFAADPNRLRGMFRNVIVEEEAWTNAISKETLDGMVDDITSIFRDWKHPMPSFETDCEEFRDRLNDFLSEHEEVYDHLSQQKSMHGEGFRSSLVAGDAIFPEESDLRIMLQACSLAESYLDGIGSVVVATRDGDFTLVARAFEERFGFGVTKNVHQLKSWLR